MLLPESIPWAKEANEAKIRDDIECGFRHIVIQKLIKKVMSINPGLCDYQDKIINGCISDVVWKENYIGVIDACKKYLKEEYKTLKDVKVYFDMLGNLTFKPVFYLPGEKQEKED